MAGGLGSRLAPLTEDCPKPMLKIGNKPLLETIIENFADFGFSNFFLSVNYKSEIIEDYFNDCDYIVGHNVLGFDIYLLRNWFRKHGKNYDGIMMIYRRSLEGWFKQGGGFANLNSDRKLFSRYRNFVNY